MELLLTNKQAVALSKIQLVMLLFFFFFNFIGTGTDNDLYINQAVVFIEDAIQVNVTYLLVIMLPMLDICHTFC